MDRQSWCIGIDEAEKEPWTTTEGGKQEGGDRG